MSKIMESIIENAKLMGKHIVLAEGEDKRIIQAAIILTHQGIAKITLLGDIGRIIEKSEGANLKGIDVINPSKASNLEEYATLLYELRKHKGITPEKAVELAKNPLYYGTLMIKTGAAHGMVAGAVNSTGDVLRPALQIIKAKPGIKTVSSCFIMALPEKSIYGEDGIMVFGDCAVMPDPTSDQLVDIAVASVDSATSIAKIKNPRVAMLSFSTKGSAKHENVEKVVNATKVLKAMNLPFELDGELQLDSAIVPEVARLKAPESTLAGKANILIFPDLQSGNIGYKMAQRLGGAEAIGPICQGLAAPVNDLSRGCTITDIVSVVAITTLQ